MNFNSLSTPYLQSPPQTFKYTGRTLSPSRFGILKDLGSESYTREDAVEEKVLFFKTFSCQSSHESFSTPGARPEERTLETSCGNINNLKSDSGGNKITGRTPCKESATASPVQLENFFPPENRNFNAPGVRPARETNSSQQQSILV